MLPMIKALIWEVLRKNRLGLLIVLFVVPVTWKLMEYIIVIAGLESVIPPQKVSTLILAFSTLYLYTIFSYIEVQSSQQVGGEFPQHILKLPLPTWVLAIVPILLSTFFILSFILIWVNFLIDSEVSILLQLVICAFVGAFIAWFQSISWGLNTPMIVKALALISIVVALFTSVLAIFNIEMLASDMSQIYGSVGLVFLLCSGYYFSFLTLAKTRCGEAFEIVWLKRLFGLFNIFAKSPRIRPLSSPLQAQFWYEWNVLAFIVPLIILIISIIVLFSISVSGNKGLILASLMIGPMTFIMSAPFLASNKLGSDKSTILPHCATRPLSNFDMGLSKLVPLAGAILSGFIIYLIAHFIAFFVLEFSEVNEVVNMLITKLGISNVIIVFALVSILLLASFWLVSANGMAIMLVDSKWIMFVLIAVFFSINALCIWAMAYYKAEPEDFKRFIQSFELYQFMKNNIYIVPLIFTSLISAIILFLLQSFRRVSKLERLTKYGVICMGLLVVCLSLLWALDLPEKLLASASHFILNVALLCFLPFIIAPISVAINRHR